ncbi:polyprenyl synthetase family protein [Chitinophaga skermanii]|nr:polyprenyl synthetase family protein [Chitinophaga skermanii]
MKFTKSVLQEELQAFSTYFDTSLKGKSALLDRITSYLLENKGKQMRPIFVLLGARMAGSVTDRTYRAALLVELLHIASLVHDDLVDDSMERRGKYSVNALWKNRSAVYTGDYIFAHSLVLSLSNGDHRILEIYTEAIRQMSELELLQMVKNKKIQYDEQAYYDLIKGKTASFLAAACSAGAASVTDDESVIARMHTFGEKLGMAFQVKDDLLDYTQQDIGKPTGNDIKEQKITLPLIYTLHNCDARTKTYLLNIVKHHNTKSDKVKELINIVEANGGMRYAEDKMHAFRDESLAVLQTFPPSEVRDCLEEMVAFTIGRAY